MPKLRDLYEKTATAELVVAEMALSVTYKPNQYTYKLMNELGEVTVPELLSRLLVSWDLEGEDDQPHPVTAAALEELPALFLRELWIALQDALLPNPRSATS